MLEERSNISLLQSKSNFSNLFPKNLTLHFYQEAEAGICPQKFTAKIKNMVFSQQWTYLDGRGKDIAKFPPSSI